MTSKNENDHMRELGELRAVLWVLASRVGPFLHSPLG